MRIDYFSLMRKWRVSLYRYGLRLTYDIAIPEPGGTLREAYMMLSDLQTQAAQGFTFPLQNSDITPQAYNDPASALWSYANQWGVPITPPPSSPGSPLTPNQTFQFGQSGWNFVTLSFSVPDGYSIADVTMNGHVGSIDPGNKDVQWNIEGSGIGQQQTGSAGGYLGPVDLGNFLVGATGSQSVTIFFQDAGPGWVGLTITIYPTQSANGQWQSSVWSSLYNAAQTAFYAQQQSINSQIQALQDKINNVDTLTLRREENDEIMKGVLRWLLGPSFDFMPSDVVALFGSPAPGTSPNDLLTHGVSFTGNDLFSGNPALWPTNWSTMFQYQEMVKFVNEAIEWENVLYFLYSYFWDVPASWDFIRQIQHPDAIRQAFLRAGSARVVLTIRKGWESAWINFVEAGGFGQTLLPGHPYLTIAQEIQDYDNTNYPGIPPANPSSDSGSTDADSVATTSSTKIDASTGSVTISVDSSAGFIAGYSAVIDTYDSGVQETQVITAVPDATHITVKMLNNSHDGSITSFPVLQPGEKGVLIAQWYEYTPTSGTDIAVTSNLATID